MKILEYIEFTPPHNKSQYATVREASLRDDLRARKSRSGLTLRTAIFTQTSMLSIKDNWLKLTSYASTFRMAEGAARVLEAVPTIVADAGYANSEHLQVLADAGQTAYLATLEKENNQGTGDYYRQTAFTYDRTRDCYVCPANELLRRKQTMRKGNYVVYAAAAESCGSCALKSQCTGTIYTACSGDVFHFSPLLLERHAQFLSVKQLFR